MSCAGAVEPVAAGHLHPDRGVGVGLAGGHRHRGGRAARTDLLAHRRRAGPAGRAGTVRVDEYVRTRLASAGPRLPLGQSALAVATGMAVTLLAALPPARRATRVPPVAAMRGSAPAPDCFSARRLVAVSIHVSLDRCRRVGAPLRS